MKETNLCSLPYTVSFFGLMPTQQDYIPVHILYNLTGDVKLYWLEWTYGCCNDFFFYLERRLKLHLHLCKRKLIKDTEMLPGKTNIDLDVSTSCESSITTETTTQHDECQLSSHRRFFDVKVIASPEDVYHVVLLTFYSKYTSYRKINCLPSPPSSLLCSRITVECLDRQHQVLQVLPSLRWKDCRQNRQIKETSVFLALVILQ